MGTFIYFSNEFPGKRFCFFLTGPHPLSYCLSEAVFVLHRYQMAAEEGSIEKKKTVRAFKFTPVCL